MRVLAGNHRLLAARQAGLETVPAMIVDVNDQTARRILLADNRTNDLASYDDAALAKLLHAAMLDGGLPGTGYDGDDLDQLLADLGEEPLSASTASTGTENAEAAQAKWQVQPGDLWEAGKHRVVCADATNQEAYTRLLGDTLVDVVWTDPPYGVSYAGNVHQQAATKEAARKSIENDSLTPAQLRTLLDDSLGKALAHTKPGGAWYISSPPGPQQEIFVAWANTNKILRQVLTWRKQRIVLGRSDYHYQHEPILYGWKPGAKHLWTGDRKQSSVLEFDRPHSSPDHPTQKPLDLIEYCIRNNTREADTVLDPFNGSGSTILAADQARRVGYGIELDPSYVAITLSRLEAAGYTPTRIGGRAND
jgi:site-specific DNA-methyltransferase (adenine-specific)